jgi:RNA polymerase-binding transcription factor DksA
VYRSEADYPLRVRDNLGMAGCDRCGAEIPEERKLATVL